MVTDKLSKLLMEKAIEIAKSYTPKQDIPISSLLIKKDEKIDNLDKILFATNTREKENLIIGHSELNVIKQVNETNLSSYCIISTLEPCVMCYGALSEARIGKLIFGAFDKKAGAFSKFDLPRNFETIGGVLENECSKLITSFFKSLR